MSSRFDNENGVRRFRTNRFLNQVGVKSDLLRYIYDNVNMSKYRYKVLNKEEELQQITSEYYISPNYSGITCLLVFVKLREKYYSFLIDRRTLQFDIDKINVEELRITPLSIRLGKDIYKGSIMDGVLLYPKLTNNRKVFMINDVYQFCGMDMEITKMTHKFMNLNSFLSKHMVDDSILNNVTLIANNVFELTSIRSVINGEIKDTVPYNTHIKGLAFYPSYSGTKLLYMYGNNQNASNSTTSTNVTKQTSVNNSSPTTGEVEKNTPLSFLKDMKMEEPLHAIFEMRKTDTVDVYKLYLIKKIKTKGKVKIKNVKIGLAYIPTDACTHLCNGMFEEDCDKVMVQCEYNNDRDKWVPVSKSDRQYPDSLTKLEKLAL